MTRSSGGVPPTTTGRAMRPHQPSPAAGHARRLWPRAGLVAGTTLVMLVGTASVAHAAVPGPALAADSIEAVVNNIRTWLLTILAAAATLFLTVGGLRLMWANGDPSEAEKGKAALRSAAIGYALALLAPLIVTIVGTG